MKDPQRDQNHRIGAALVLAKIDPTGDSFSKAIETLIEDGAETWNGDEYFLVKTLLPLLVVDDSIKHAEKILSVARRREENGDRGMSSSAGEARRIAFEANRDRKMETVEGDELIRMVVADWIKGTMDLTDRGRGVQTLLRRGLADQAIAAARDQLKAATNEVERGRLFKLMDELGAELSDEETIVLDRVFPPFTGE